MNTKEKAMLKGMKTGVAIRIAGLEVEIERLQEENAAMVKQLNDQDLRMEKQHREWQAEIERLEATIKKQETGLACLRGLQGAGNDMCDDLRREWKKSEDEIERLQVELECWREQYGADTPDDALRSVGAKPLKGE